MKDEKRKGISRRTLLLNSGSLTLGSAFLLHYPGTAFCLNSALSEQQYRSLVVLIYTLFPHKNFPAKFFSDFADRLIERSQKQPEKYDLLVDGLSKLNSDIGEKSWFGLDKELQHVVIIAMQESPLFSYVRSNAIEIIYRDDRVWKLIGYGGSAMEKGGYVHNANYGKVDWIKN